MERIFYWEIVLSPNSSENRPVIKKYVSVEMKYNIIFHIKKSLTKNFFLNAIISLNFMSNLIDLKDI